MMLLIWIGFAAFAAAATFLSLTASDDLEGRIRSVLGGFIGTFAWGMVAFGAFNIEVSVGGGVDPISKTYPAIAVFAVGMGVLSIVLAFVGPFEIMARLDPETEMEDI